MYEVCYELQFPKFHVRISLAITCLCLSVSEAFKYWTYMSRTVSLHSEYAAIRWYGIVYCELRWECRTCLKGKTVVYY